MQKIVRLDFLLFNLDLQFMILLHIRIFQNRYFPLVPFGAYSAAGSVAADGSTAPLKLSLM